MISLKIMKEIKGNYTGDIIWVLAILTLFGICIFGSKLPTLDAFLLALPIIAVVLFIISIREFYFLYDEKKVVVKHVIYKFLTYEYNLSEIKKIKLIPESTLGGGIRFFFKNGNKKFFYTNVSNDKISLMIQETEKE